MKTSFPKVYLSPPDIVSLLIHRGLCVSDISKACEYIRNIGYYRLSAFLYPLLEEPKERQVFKVGSSIETAFSLYRFDKKLRIFLFNEIEKIEVSFRSTLANIACRELSNIFWMTDAAVFRDSAKYKRTMNLIDEEMSRSKEDFIANFKFKYSNRYPPAWMLVEILPLGVLTRIYENIASNRLRKMIVEYYDLPVPVFISWMTVITLTRNSCCHHSRIWNRQYPISPMAVKKPRRSWIPEGVPLEKCFYEICIVKWFIDIVSPCNDMKAHLLGLLREFPNVDIKAMGMHKGWETDPLWAEG